MIILFGVVGSGKSEQSRRLVKKLRCPHISTSNLLRHHLTPERENKMMAGKLVSDKDIFELLSPELKKMDSTGQEFILDGAPRSIPQAKWLVGKIRNNHIRLTAIILLKVSKETVFKRLLKRGRKDDKKEVISQRFKEYDQNTVPVIDYLKKEGFKIYEIDGERSVDKVEAQINAVLEEAKAK